MQNSTNYKKSNKILKSDICVYTTANEEYIPKALISLLSFRYHNPEIDLYILSNNFISNKSKNLLKKYNIKLLVIYPENLFYKSFQYPVECYYIFYGPQVFINNYKYSMYIDGDIYCDKPINIDFYKIKNFAGVSIGKIKSVFPNDWNDVFNHWKFTSIPDYRIQSGVVIFNNSSMIECNFLHVIGEIYDKSIKVGLPRKGDDSLFSLFQILRQDIDPYILPYIYNYIPGENLSVYATHSSDSTLENPILIHFTNNNKKPWKKIKSNSNAIHQKKWQSMLIKNLSFFEVLQYFPSFLLNKARNILQ